MTHEHIAEITTTSVGRGTLVRAYDSFFAHARFGGRFRVLVTIDPAYGVDPAEIAATRSYLDRLPERHPQVAEVHVEEFPRPVGLVAALRVLLSLSIAEVGVHLEDDWEFGAPVNLDAIIEALRLHDSTEIVLTNSHAARNGTFERPAEVEEVEGPVRLRRLRQGSWAANYVPLCPHVHDGRRWRALFGSTLAALTAGGCPDEAVRERVIRNGERGRHNVLWTRDVVVHDRGRAWLAERGRHKSIEPGNPGAVDLVPPSGLSPAGPIELRRSRQWRDRAEAVIPGMTGTYLKRPANFADGDYPVYVEGGAGATLRDVDGRTYIDFVCSLGAATLGHNHPAVTGTIRDRVGRGVLFSLPSPPEVTAAEQLVVAVPGVDMVRFLKTGADACSAAIRLARYTTGRDRVILAGYHGWHDQLMGTGAGIPAAIGELAGRVALRSDADDDALVAAVRAADPPLAAVLISTPYHRQLGHEFLARLRAACDETATVLVFDEVVTGFRLAPGGLSEHRGVVADLLCFSKGIAAGLPLAALAGPAEQMRPLAGLPVSTTFGGEAMSLEVMRAALREYSSTDYYERIASLGRRLRTGINAASTAAGLGEIAHGYDTMPCLVFAPDPAEHAACARDFLAAMARRGVLLRRDVNFISAAHTAEQVDHTICAVHDALAEVSAGDVAVPA